MTPSRQTCVSSLKIGQGIFKYERDHKYAQCGVTVKRFSFLKAQNDAKDHNKVNIYIRIQSVEYGKWQGRQKERNVRMRSNARFYVRGRSKEKN